MELSHNIDSTTRLPIFMGTDVHRHLNALGIDGQATQDKVKGLSIEGMLETSFLRLDKLAAPDARTHVYVDRMNQAVC